VTEARGTARLVAPGREVLITVDVEPDCPPYLGGWRGVREGLPRLLDLLAAEGVPATLFATGETARLFPDVVRGAVAAGHELGCHGDTHERFSRMERSAARDEIARASAVLRAIAPTTAFRAPNLDFPDRFLPLLVEAGYRTDSSEGAHRIGHRLRAARGGGPAGAPGLVRVRASTTSSALRLPARLRDPWLARLPAPVVLFVHPWEFVDLRRAPIPWDCRAGTGPRALAALREVIRLFRGRGARFATMRELAA
jgi:peptidoglycan/xylan/chitin deacetylase (PgdA/CDA1 family)